MTLITNNLKVGAAIKIFATLFIIMILPYTQSFDLVSSLMSQAPSLSEKLPLPNLKSLLGSSEAVQKLLQTRGLLPFMSADATPTNPIELNKLLAQLKPKQGRFDPALLDMLSNFEQNNENVPNIFGNTHELPPIISRRMPTSTEENGIIWSSTSKPEINGRKTVPNVRNRFSSKFRNKTKTIPPINSDTNRLDSNEVNETLSTTEGNVQAPPMPFDHITDPNIRNHRLYDWEFETYQNFTHIDQAEDLMADESEPSEMVLKGTLSTIEGPKYVPTTSTVPTHWVPKVGTTRLKQRPGSPSDSSSSSGDLNDVLPGTYVRLPSDSDEPVTARPREPLRESSTENLIFSHSSSEDRDRIRDRYNRYKDRDRSEETRSDNIRDKFRPSPPELSPPIFVDPDQDFFTSTIRNPSDEKGSDEYHNSLNGFRSPARRHRKNKHRGQDKYIKDNRGDRYDDRSISSTHSSSSNTNKKYYSDEEEEYYKKMERERLERNRDEITNKPIRNNLDPSSEIGIVDRDQDPRPYPEDDTKDQPPKYPLKYTDRAESSQEHPINPHSHRKSDRILNPALYPEDLPSQGQESSSNYNPAYSSSDSQFQSSVPYGPASNEYDRTRGQSNMDYNNNNNNNNNNDPNGYYNYNQNNNDYGPAAHSPGHQNYAGGYENQYSHPFGGEEESHVEQYTHSDDSSSWYNTYFILGGLIALSALTAFLLPTLLSTMGRNGKNRNDLQDEDLQGEYVDENTSTSATNPTSGDPTSDSDLWTEIKGVYNDVVKIVKGDYGGIVDKLSGTKDKDGVDGPNIVYRDEEDDELSEEEVYISNKNKNRNKNNNSNKHNKNILRNRKGNPVKNSDKDATTSSSSTHDKNDRAKKSTKNRTISSTINYVVKNNGFPMETSRGAPPFLRNETMAGFHFGNASSSGFTTSTDFLGEWSKVQLIGN